VSKSKVFFKYSYLFKMVNLGDVFPDFEAETTQGQVQFHEWLGDS